MITHLIGVIFEEVEMTMESLLWTSKPYGPNRSIVRKIGTNLSLIQCPRVRFQLTSEGSRSGHLREDGVVSLADVGWVAEEEGEASTRLRSEIWQKSQLFSNAPHYSGRTSCNEVPLPKEVQEKSESASAVTANDEALQKISALENELANLRAQIAKIVSVQEQQNLTAAGVSSAALTPVPPPPPPPPPLPLPPQFQQTTSAIELIKERKGKRINLGPSLIENDPKKSEIPNMLEILKDMSNVKLRSVKRPDEGTKRKADPTDPAALIAEALKKKFAYRYRNDSTNEIEKQTLVPETRPFGPHILKSTGKMKTLVENN